MTYTEENEMRGTEFFKKVLVPVGSAALLAALFYPLCVENSQCDYLKLWIFVGIPFGVQRMFLWIIPRGFDIGSTVGIVAFNLLIGGVICGIILTGRLILAAGYLLKGIIKVLFHFVGIHGFQDRTS